jgi:anti-sigma B factor antagonist
MFNIRRADNGDVVLSGRLDASQAETARAVFKQVVESCSVDFGGLEYISSLGLGVLLETQRRLGETGHGLKLTKLNPHLSDLFRLAGFDTLFEIE